MDGTQFVVSMLGGGLAGGCVNTAFNRIFYWRSLRIQFYPKLCDTFSVYRKRLDNQEDRYWITTVGKPPSPNDDNFIRYRSHFVLDLIQFTELREVRSLRSKLVKNMLAAGGQEGTVIKTDLMPEFDALRKCVRTVQIKLRLS
jgi:hypothetical protein